MRCLICNKDGKVVQGVKVYVTACDAHADLYRRLEAQNGVQQSDEIKSVYKSGRRIR